MNKKEKEIVEACKRVQRLASTFYTPCEKCNIEKICCNYSDFPEKIIRKWESSDVNAAYTILTTQPLGIKLEDVDIQQLMKEDLTKFSDEEILDYLKYIDNEREKLLEQIQYDYECSLGWDI